MVSAAKLRTIIGDINLYKSAYNSFKLQYDALPGDIKNAYDYWGAAAGCTNNDINTTSGGCNGDGNRRINNRVAGVDTVRQEEYKAWQFLALSGLIPGTYSGARWTTPVPGSNIPATRYASNVGVSFTYSDQYYRNTSYSARANNGSLNKNFMLFGTVISNMVAGSFLQTKDIFSLDQKIDDGLPEMGFFLGYTGRPASGSSEDPVVNHCSTANAYILSHNVVACAFMTKMDF